MRALRFNGAVDFISKPLENIDQLWVSINLALQTRRERIERKTLLRRLEKSNEEMKSIVHELTNKLSEADRQFLPEHAGEVKRNR